MADGTSEALRWVADRLRAEAVVEAARAGALPYEPVPYAEAEDSPQERVRPAHRIPRARRRPATA